MVKMIHLIYHGEATLPSRRSAHPAWLLANQAAALTSGRPTMPVVVLAPRIASSMAGAATPACTATAGAPCRHTCASIR